MNTFLKRQLNNKPIKKRNNQRFARNFHKKACRLLNKPDGSYSKLPILLKWFVLLWLKEIKRRKQLNNLAYLFELNIQRIFKVNKFKKVYLIKWYILLYVKVKKLRRELNRSIASPSLLAKWKIYREFNNLIYGTKEYAREKHNFMRSNNLYFKLQHNLRSRFYMAIKRNSKKGSVLKLLGCSIDKFKRHIEKQFTEGMSWDNYGSFWEIDHIKPVVLCDHEDIESLKLFWNFNNLRPLEVFKNRSRSKTG